MTTAELRVRSCYRLREAMYDHPEAPEAIEFFDWRLLPFTMSRKAVVPILDAVPSMASAFPGPDPVKHKIQRATVERVAHGKIGIAHCPKKLKYWIGWNTYWQVAVICCEEP